jgi:type IV pilus assembly protein PilC
MSRAPGDPPRRPKPATGPGGSHSRPKPTKGRPEPEPVDPYELTEADPAPIDQAPTTWKPAAGARPGAAKKAPDKPSREPKPEAGGPNWFERILFGRVSTKHLATFSRQFAAYLQAGVDLIRSLDSLEKQFSRTALGPVIGRLGLSVRRGEALAEAMAKEPQAFDTLFLSMIRVAEARGGVPETLRRMGEHYEARDRLIRQGRSAMIYPVIVLTLAFGVGMLLTIFVLPALVGMMEDGLGGRRTDLPMTTQILIGFSRFVGAMGWWLIPLVVFGTVFGLVWAYRTKGGKAFLDELALYIPVLGKLLRKIDTARFARTLSALLGAGVDYGESLDLTADVLHLIPFRRAVRRSRSAVVEGHDLSESLGDTGRFGPDVIAIISSGEETGKLPESLEHLADDYEEQVEYMVKNLASLIQPILLLGIGGVVFFIVLAFVMAYASMISRLAGGGL